MSCPVAPSIDGMNDKKQVLEVKEGANVRLLCAASGQPNPLITWRREDKRPILVDDVSCLCLNATPFKMSNLNVSVSVLFYVLFFCWHVCTNR